MFYDTAHCGGFPWDTVVKLYRSTTPPPFPTVNDHALHFLNWLHEDLAPGYNMYKKLMTAAFLEYTETNDLDAPLPSFTTGAVFAGFGTDQIYPAVVAQKITVSTIGGLVSPAAMITYGPPPPEPGTQPDGWRDTEVAHHNDGHIRVFGQTQEVGSFLFGFSDAYDVILRAVMENEIKTVLMNENVAEETAQRLAGDILDKGLNAFRVQHVVHRTKAISKIVAELPKEELAAAAEAVVNMASLWQQITGSPTVGGPVDVAVISKGDGLVWVKRKHYFKPELNLRYIERNRSPRGGLK